MDDKYEITILNWDKYQRETKGGRRHWVAISVDLYSDPDYIEMTSMYRDAWIGLLLHAGKVGPVFKLRPSDARLLFKLRRSPDFQVLKNQGFIDFQNATNKTDKTDKKIYKKAGKKQAGTPSKRVPKNWELSESGREFAQKQGMTLATIEEQVAAFRDHEYKTAKKDFDACWRTWCRNWKKWNPGDVQTVVTQAEKKYTNTMANLTDEERRADARKAEQDMLALRKQAEAVK